MGGLSSLNKERKRATKKVEKEGQRNIDSVKSAGEEVDRAIDDIEVTFSDAWSGTKKYSKEILTTAALAMIPVIGPSIATAYATTEYTKSQMPGIPDIEEPAALTDPAAAPSIADADIQAALELGRKKRAQQAGRQSTVRTTPLGLTQRAEVQKKELLGV